jgi:hypothetical protein
MGAVSAPLEKRKESLEMRRITIIGGVVALLVALFATAALAANFQCTNRDCFGTPNNDRIVERGGNNVNDNIFGRAGNDTLRAEPFEDDRDVLRGGRGRDTLNAADGDDEDVLRGGRGFDTCFGDIADTFVNCQVVNN